MFKKIQNNKCRLALACLYFVYTNKPLKVEEDVNGQKVDLFNISTQQNNQQQNDSSQGQQDSTNQQGNVTQQPQQNTQTTQQGESFGRRNNLRKIYDYYIWQK